MIDLGPHAVFIVWAYVGVALVTLGLVLVVALNARAKRRTLARMEAARRGATETGA